MTATRARRGERGSSMIEVMIATTILIVAALGFAGTSQFAASSTGVAHRRTAATLLRAGLIDRLHVMPRSVLRGVAAAGEDTWVIDRCYDQYVQLLAGGANDGYAADFECPDGTYYRSWIRVHDNNDAASSAWSMDTNTWAVGLYVERVDRGCSPETRDSALNCVTADLLLTD